MSNPDTTVYIPVPSEHEIINVISKVAEIVREQGLGHLTCADSYKQLRALIFPHMTTTHESADSLIEQLKGLNLYSPDKREFDPPKRFAWQECCETLHTLLTGKILTTPQAISDVWDASTNSDLYISGKVSFDKIQPDKATYLKEHFKIEPK